jgi:alkanesulfonate monooxygenase SsuD/methylene tetrahydromethanopterin reductase-like flavin-dependent oxidoreductase (luciferase family)
MKAFNWQLRKKGYIPPPGDCRQSPAGQRMAGQIVDASLVPAPKRRNTEDEKQAIKEGKTAHEIRPDEPDKAARKDRLCLESGGNSLAAFSEHVDFGLIRPLGQG